MVQSKNEAITKLVATMIDWQIYSSNNKGSIQVEPFRRTDNQLMRDSNFSLSAANCCTLPIIPTTDHQHGQYLFLRREHLLKIFHMRQTALMHYFVFPRCSHYQRLQNIFPLAADFIAKLNQNHLCIEKPVQLCHCRAHTLNLYWFTIENQDYKIPFKI